MKRGLFVIVFIFSLVMNIAVAATLLVSRWQTQDAHPIEQTPAASMSAEDSRMIANLLPQQRRADMIRMRQDVIKKKVEILEKIAQNPDDFRAVEPQIQQLIGLRGQMERQALERISAIMANLPPEKRPAFLEFLKTRACLMGHGRGMHMRRGMGGMWGPRQEQIRQDLGSDNREIAGPRGGPASQ
ncbi:MAG: hypothetical protein AB1733_02655 [Thermodesulfobacteriota bacterium]